MLDANKSAEQVYVGSRFAVVAGNVALKNPSVPEFLQPEVFLSLVCHQQTQIANRGLESRRSTLEIL